MKKILLTIISILPVVSFVGFMLYQYIVNEPPARKAQAVLETEFAKVKTPSWASLIGKISNHKPGQALVEATYTTSVGYKNIRSYYDGELVQKGWRFVGEEGVRDWGRDLGGKEAYYRKGDYDASLQYAGEKGNYGWTYSLDLSIGMDGPETKAHGGWKKLSIAEALLFLGFFFPLVFLSIHDLSAPNRSTFEKVVRVFLFFASLAFVFYGAHSLWSHLFGG